MAKIRILAAIAATGVTALAAPAIVLSDEPAASTVVVEDDGGGDEDRGPEASVPAVLAAVDRFGPSGRDARSTDSASSRSADSTGDSGRTTTSTTSATEPTSSGSASASEASGIGPGGGAVPSDLADTATGSTGVASQPATPVSGSTARFAWFYKPPANASAAELAERFDVIVLTRNDESFRDQLQAADPSLRVLQYVLANEIQDAGANQPWRNQAAWTTGDAASLLAQHPDWFARDDAGQPLAKSTGGGRTIYTMDPAQRGWTDYLIDRVLTHNTAAGWDGVFLDNVEMSLSKRRREGQIPAAHPTDQAWQDAMVGHVAVIHAAFAAAGRPVWANVIEGGQSVAEIDRLAPHLEGTMDESFGTGWDRRPRTGSAWEQDLTAVEERTARGDHSLLVAQGANGDRDALGYAFASYLLVAGPNVSFRYADSATAYAEVWWSDEFDRQLGAPTGPRYRAGDTWARDFQGGRVVVDPTRGTATIS